MKRLHDVKVDKEEVNEFITGMALETAKLDYPQVELDLEDIKRIEYDRLNKQFIVTFEILQEGIDP